MPAILLFPCFTWGEWGSSYCFQLSSLGIAGESESVHAAEEQNARPWAGGTRAVGRTGRGVGPSPSCPRPGARRCWRGDGAAAMASCRSVARCQRKRLPFLPACARAWRQQVLTRGSGGCAALGGGASGVPPARHVGSARLQGKQRARMCCGRRGSPARRGKALLRARWGLGSGLAGVAGVTLVVRGTVFFRGCLPVLEEFGGAAKLWMQARSARNRAARTALQPAGGQARAAAPGLPPGLGVRVAPAAACPRCREVCDGPLK